tara:strand:+ start:3963 stop:5504 length:1542 start_codon:yes stop_codon:yes gene_type:complete
MADIFSNGTISSIQSDVDLGSSGVRKGTELDTGKLRRKFNFGDRVSELALSQDPFFRFVSKVAKQSTDDPAFKFTERRGSYHKRYAYVAAVKNNSATWVETNDFGAELSSGGAINVRMMADYMNQGNRQNVFGNTTGEIKVGAAGTMPKFFVPNQMVKIPVATSAGGGAYNDYMIMKIDSVTEVASAGGTDVNALADSNSGDYVELSGKVVRMPSTAADSQYVAVTQEFAGDSVASSSISGVLEKMRSYVVGSGFLEGSGYPATWKDQPFATGYGQTQIWKTSMAMTNTMRATQLKYEQNEWSRIWKEKLIEHKWDIEQSLLFGSQGTVDDVNYTQGAVDFILNYGNKFTLDTNTATADSFLDDMSNYLDPRYNNAKGTVFFCDTFTYNWLHKLGGYFANNVEISSNFRADMSISGRKKILGIDITTITTPYGDMNVARNVHLDGTNIRLIGVNMNHCKYRPLVGNGLNRDTSVYVGVQTLENSGVDRRVDMILTEAGMQWEMPEAHAVWTAA